MKVAYIKHILYRF